MVDQRMIKAVAGADLATAGKILVKYDGTDGEQVAVQASDTSVETLGILCGGTNRDTEEVDVVTEGYTTAIAGGAIEPYDTLMAATGGKVVKATTGKVIVGRYVPTRKRDAASNDEIRIELYAQKDRLLA